ncbi:dephospho-CoA kinase [Cognatiluteimonas profundi]|uniref:dephospho-CoA kinase n=1 Tax=Cognatiluteimonas profundi TaxID=2594501 RepID=UPI00131CDC2D|nr:dephospho-CoA kinase [Lysobacter profundi]
MSDYIIGLTGGVASGKSVVAQAFRDLGVAVVDADIAAREAVAPGTDGLAEVVSAFGVEVLDAHGALDRVAMRQRVFTDTDARRRLEAIVHPRVRAALQAASAAAPGSYVVVAIPLLAEGGGRDGYPWLDRILVVDTPVATQLARLLQRDGIDVALAERMVAAQASRRDRLAIADDILVNDGEIAALDGPIRALDNQYRLLASAIGSL